MKQVMRWSRWRGWVIAVGVVVCGAGTAWGGTRWYETAEWMVADAEVVARGRIVGWESSEGRPTSGLGRATLEVEEVIKGPKQRQFVFGMRYFQSPETKEEVLVCLKRVQRADWARWAEWGLVNNDEALMPLDAKAEVCGIDLRLRRGREEVLELVRQAVHEEPSERPKSVTYSGISVAARNGRPTYAGEYVTFPLDYRVEELARRCLKEKDMPHLPMAYPGYVGGLGRWMGMELLGHFKSAENARLLRELAAEPYNDWHFDGGRDVRASSDRRGKVLAILEAWGESLEGVEAVLPEDRYRRAGLACGVMGLALVVALMVGVRRWGVGKVARVVMAGAPVVVGLMWVRSCFRYDDLMLEWSDGQIRLSSHAGRVEMAYRAGPPRVVERIPWPEDLVTGEDRRMELRIGGRPWGVDIERERWREPVQPEASPTMEARGLRYACFRPGELDKYFEIPWTANKRVNGVGVVVAEGVSVVEKEDSRSQAAAVTRYPMWYGQISMAWPMGLGVLGLGWVAWGVGRKWRQKREGCCLACGYDLRATSEEGGPLVERCPECGKRLEEERRGSGSTLA